MLGQGSAQQKAADLRAGNRSEAKVYFHVATDPLGKG